MLFLTRGRWRTTATAMTAGALAATTLAFAGAPAQAAEGETSLQWGISQQFVDHLSTRTLADGATFDAGVFTFPLVDVDVADGTTTYTYDGSVRGAFAMAGTEYYSVSLAEPTVVVDGDGSGEINAVVSAKNAAAMGNPAGETSPARVVVAEFEAATLAEEVLTATPNWDGVLAAGSDEAVALGIETDEPVDGKSFHPDFLGQLTSSVRAHFYASGGSSDAKKAPAEFAATATPYVSASATVNGDYVDVSVRGANFDAESRPGATGVYAAFGPKKNIFKLNADGETDGVEAFIGTDWVDSARFADGAWSSSIGVEKAKLKKGVTYAVYTWTAHGNPTEGDSQYTETIVNVPGLPKNNSKTVIKLKKKPTTKKKGKAVVKVKGVAGVKASGKVRVVLKKGKQTKKTTVKLNKKGKAAVKIGKLKKGKWKIVAKYKADKNFKKSKKAKKFKVKK